MPVYGELFVYGKGILSESQKRVARCRSEAAHRGREQARKWAGRKRLAVLRTATAGEDTLPQVDKKLVTVDVGVQTSTVMVDAEVQATTFMVDTGIQASTLMVDSGVQTVTVMVDACVQTE